MVRKAHESTPFGSIWGAVLVAFLRNWVPTMGSIHWFCAVSRCNSLAMSERSLGPKDRCARQILETTSCWLTQQPRIIVFFKEIYIFLKLGILPKDSLPVSEVWLCHSWHWSFQTETLAPRAMTGHRSHPSTLKPFEALSCEQSQPASVRCGIGILNLSQWFIHV